jgi:hypothetical protein
MQDLVIKISQATYQKLLISIKVCIKKSEDNFNKVLIRKKLEICWQIGGIIEQSLLKNKKYGEGLFIKLEKDTLISSRALYKMHLFYKTYPKLPNDGLNWSHYQSLMGIKDKKSRRYFTNTAIKDNLSARDLVLRIKNLKNNTQKNSLEITQPSAPVLNKLFCYYLVEFKYSPKTIYADCGFNVFKKIKTKIELGSVVESIKSDSDNYSFQQIILLNKKTHTYKAYLQRVVDGDTIRVIIDLGFGIFHKEILRLKQVYAAENHTKEGLIATKKLTNLLQGASFLIIKTSKIDIYGRYVADVFLEGKDYLNQLLWNR